MRHPSARRARRGQAAIYPDLPEFRWQGSIFLLGLTGGIASGKSLAAQTFQKCGARVLDADLLAKEALESKELRPALVQLFKEYPSIEKNGTLDRAYIASLVFSHTDLLEGLNRLIHPFVQQKLQKAVEGLPSGGLCVYDVPLLFEASDVDLYDAILVISAPLEIRLQRAQTRSGWSRKEFLGREAQQIPLSEKEKLADLVIENTHGQAFLSKAVENICAAILHNRPASLRP